MVYRINDNNLLNESLDYIQGCLNNEYEFDEELYESCIDIINEATREMKEFKKKGDYGTIGAFNRLRPHEDTEHKLHRAIGNIQWAKSDKKLYGDKEELARITHNVNRANANEYAKQYLKNGGSKEELKNRIENAKQSANKDIDKWEKSKDYKDMKERISKKKK